MPSNFEIYHNPRCSKSRQTLKLLQDAGIEPTIVEYLKEPPAIEHIEELLGLLGFEDPRRLMRRGEAEYKELGLKQEEDPGALVAAMHFYPKLMERPIVVKDGKQAVLGRPPENVEQLL